MNQTKRRLPLKVLYRGLELSAESEQLLEEAMEKMDSDNADDTVQAALRYILAYPPPVSSAALVAGAGERAAWRFESASRLARVDLALRHKDVMCSGLRRILGLLLRVSEGHLQGPQNRRR